MIFTAIRSLDSWKWLTTYNRINFGPATRISGFLFSRWSRFSLWGKSFTSSHVLYPKGGRLLSDPSPFPRLALTVGVIDNLTSISVKSFKTMATAYLQNVFHDWSTWYRRLIWRGAFCSILQHMKRPNNLAKITWIFGSCTEFNSS